MVPATVQLGPYLDDSHCKIKASPTVTIGSDPGFQYKKCLKSLSPCSKQLAHFVLSEEQRFFTAIKRLNSQTHFFKLSIAVLIVLLNTCETKPNNLFQIHSSSTLKEQCVHVGMHLVMYCAAPSADL